MPTHSARQWSTATNTAAWPSPVQVVVRSVPHMVSTASGMMVPSWAARAPGRADPRGREQVVLAHQPQHPALGGAHPGVAQPGPDLAVPLAVEGAGGEHGADRLHQRRVRHRPDRARAPRRRRARRRAVPVDGGPRRPPDPAHPGQAVGPAAAGRDGPAHGLDLRRAKGRPPSRAAIFASSSSCVEQHLAEPRLQPLALQRLAVGGPGRQARLAGGQEGVAPAAQRRRGHAQRARDRLQVLAPQQPQHRVPLALPRHPPAPARTRCAVRRLCRHRHLSADSVRLRGVPANRGAEEDFPPGTDGFADKSSAPGHLVAWIRQESSRIRHLWRLIDSEILSLFSCLAYPCNKVTPRPGCACRTTSACSRAALLAGVEPRRECQEVSASEPAEEPPRVGQL